MQDQAINELIINSPDLLDELSGLSDDVGPGEAHDAGHLHGVPARPGGHTQTGRTASGLLQDVYHQTIKGMKLLPFPHDVAVERVEDALVSQLQRVVQDLHVLAALHLGSVSAVLSHRQLLLPHLELKK